MADPSTPGSKRRRLPPGIVRLPKRLPRAGTGSGDRRPLTADRSAAIGGRLYRPQPDLPEDWGEVAPLYDIEQPSCRGDEAKFWQDEAVAAGASAAHPVVELAAGSGRVALAVARRGHHVVGVELSPRMVARAEGRTSRLPDSTKDRVRWVVGDMASFDLGELRASLIFVAFNSFWLLDSAAQDRCLSRIRGQLVPGGRLILDLFPPTIQDYTDEDAITQFLGRRWHGKSVLRVKDYRYDASTNRAVSDVRYYATDHDRGSPAAVISQFRYVLHPEAPELVEARLTRAGFEVNARHGSYDRGPIEPDSARAIFIATLRSG